LSKRYTITLVVLIVVGIYWLQIFETETTQSAADAPLDSASYSCETESLTADMSTKVVQDQARRLKSVSGTQWSCRKDVTRALLRNYGCVIDCLARLSDCRHDAGEVQQAHDLQRKLGWTFLLSLMLAINTFI